MTEAAFSKIINEFKIAHNYIWLAHNHMDPSIISEARFYHRKAEENQENE